MRTRNGTRTTRSGPESSQARVTSASGTARAPVPRDPTVIAAASDGSSERICVTPTDP
ncbi:MAG TPA: hypothetical protein VF060_13995 [Trebonia sp.]